MRRLKQEHLFLLVALALTVGAGLYLALSQPGTLRVAVAEGREETTVIEGLAQALEQERRDIRLKLVPVKDLGAAAGLVERKEVDLAVIRPDVSFPVNGLTVAVMREEAALIFVPKAAKIETLAELQGKRLGLVTRHEADLRFLTSVLQFYELAPPAVTLSQLQADGVEAALKERRVDAVVVVATPGSQEAREVLRAAERAAPRGIATLSVAEGEAIAKSMPAVSAIEVPAGALGGRPRQPDEALNTVGVSYRLVARADLDASRVATMTRHLFELRPRVARSVPVANRMTAPESTLSATLPVHPGAIQYLERETLTFFERYGDYIYLLMFSMGGIGSAMAWLMQRLVRRRRELVDEVLDSLMGVLSEARCATTAEELDRIAEEVDTLVTHAIRYARNHAMSVRTVSALTMAMDSARFAIADRRELLERQREEASRLRPVRQGSG